MFKKIAAFAASILMLATVGAVSAIAANPQAATPRAPSNSAWVTLGPKDTVVRSQKVYGGYKFFGGTNTAASAHSVYFDAHYTGSSTGYKDITATSVLASSGVTLTDIETKHYATAGDWYLELNPYGLWTASCIATGYIWYS